MNLYIVSYRVEGRATIAQDTINLRTGTPSEAVAELKRRGTVRQEEVVIIISLVPANNQK